MAKIHVNSSLTSVSISVDYISRCDIHYLIQEYIN